MNEMQTDITPSQDTDPAEKTDAKPVQVTNAASQTEPQPRLTRRRRKAAAKPVGQEVVPASDQNEETIPEKSVPGATRPTRRRGSAMADSLLRPRWTNHGSRHHTNDLPPDYVAEIKGRRKEIDHTHSHMLRPIVPMLLVKAEFHCPEFQRFYVGSFETVNEYAIAMDVVARNRLEDRAAYEKYMKQMDNLIEVLFNYAKKRSKQYEKASNGGVTDSQSPMIVDAKLQSPISKRFLDCLTLLDSAARHASFMTIFGSIDREEYAKFIKNAENETTKTIRAIQKLKRQCFDKIRAEAQQASTKMKSEAQNGRNSSRQHVVRKRENDTNVDTEAKTRAEGMSIPDEEED